MDLRDFFTKEEIEAMKSRIVKEVALSNFLVNMTVKYPNGEIGEYREIRPEIEKVVRDETTKQMKEYVREVIDKVARERVAASVDKFTDNLCNQLEKIASKTNWYWSIR